MPPWPSRASSRYLPSSTSPIRGSRASGELSSTVPSFGQIRMTSSYVAPQVGQEFMAEVLILRGGRIVVKPRFAPARLRFCHWRLVLPRGEIRAESLHRLKDVGQRLVAAEDQLQSRIERQARPALRGERPLHRAPDEVAQVEARNFLFVARGQL